MTTSPTIAPTSVAFADLDTGVLVWVCLCIYLVLLLSVAMIGFVKSLALKTEKEKIDDHFIASRGLSYVVLALTVFSTVFSGYTVVGVPGEVWDLGFFGFRWLLTICQMIYPMMFMASRLLTLSHARNYVSPTDFIKDRYGCWSLTWFTSLAMFFPAIVYVMAQFITMGATIQSLSNGKIDDFHAASLFCIIMIIYEVFGGLRAIAYTDAVQGIVLIVGFLLFFIAQEDLFGGIADANSVMSAEGLNVMLSKDEVQSWIGFGTILCISFAFYPQIVIRSQAAKNGNVVKYTYIFLICGTWLVMIAGAFIGMAANVYIGRPDDDFSNANGVFGLVVRRTISENEWYNILGSIMLTASVAAQMSTADSAINACVSLLTLDFLDPLVPATYEKKHKVVLYVGKLLTIAVALTALFLSRVNIGLGALITLQGMVLCQVAPAYILGFFDIELHAYPLLAGQVIGVAISITYQCATDYCVQSSSNAEWFGPWEGIQPGFFGLIVNILVFLIGNIAYVYFKGGILSCDKLCIEKFESKIPSALLTLKADGISRPWNKPFWGIVLLIAFIIQCFTTPWWYGNGNLEPDYSSDYFPRWVMACGGFRLLGDILLITAIAMGWKDGKQEPRSQEEESGERGPGYQETELCKPGNEQNPYKLMGTRL